MSDVLRTRWSEIGDKIVLLAEEFPAEHYEFRPAEGTRSFAEQLRHVAFWNDYVRESLAGKDPDGSANELPAGKFPSKKEILPALRRSFDGVSKAISKTNGDAPLDTLVSFIEHNGEHYGQMVLYSRMKHIVPPASRG
jgi:hypothetical protein